MDDLQLPLCCELKVPGYTDALRSNATKPTILAADDDEDNLLLLAYALEPLGCTLLTAVDGSSALAIARSFQPDLILLDVLMPHMDGVEVVSHLRKNSTTKAISVIAVTALAIVEDRERLLRAGFNDYISKPYLLEDIEALVRRHLLLRRTIFSPLEPRQDCELLA
jgi:CheY-like chemotaxis protein